MASSELNKGTILLVDDEPNVLWFISKVCQPRGYATLTAGSGLEALKYIQECGGKLDLVLLDLRMPGMDGLEVLVSIRKHQPHLPVIILTALSDKKEACEALGIEAYIQKPYSLEELYEHIEAVMERKTFDQMEAVLPEGVEPSAKLLIVDDDKEMCEILCAALYEDLQDADFKVKWVESGDEAIKISTEFEPDIAIVDIKMPKMWGDELVQRFKSGEGYCPRDFIIYTAVNDPYEVERARKLGHKCLSKPTNIDTLYDVLKKICIKHNLLHKKES